MERIASFTVDHDVLVPGLYLSRQDGDVVTLDLRFKKPNTGDLLTNAEMHSVEHVIATLLRNSPEKDAVVYFGPMGCQTGFYFLFDGKQLTLAQAVALVQRVFAQGRYLRAKCQEKAQRSAATTAIWTWSWRRRAARSIRRSFPGGTRRNWPIPRRKAGNFCENRQKQRLSLLTREKDAVILDKPL